jgi:ribosomal protein S6--L-glutamate ligase
MVMEVNSSPGLEGIQKTTGVDVAAAIIEHVEEEVAHQRGPEPVARRKKKRAS